MAALLLSLVLFFVVASVKARAEDQLNYGITCIKIVSTYRPACVAEYPCLDRPADLKVGSKIDHIFKLSGTGFPANEDVYIIGCVETGGNFRCTTGSDATDAQVRNLGFALAKDSGHEFTVIGANPQKASADGSLSFNARSYTAATIAHAFYGVYRPKMGLTTGEANSLQYGTFQFNQDASNCTSIRWDPKGRVFDSVSLEPLPSATVKILDENKSTINIPGLMSNLTTVDDGSFSFFVEPGTYYFDVSKTNYQFPAETNLNQNYIKAYYCDQDKNNNYPIYNQQYPVVEENKIIHCDVPLDPGTNPPYRSTPKITKIGSVSMPPPPDNPIQTRYSGSVTHPLTIITLVGDETGKEYARTTADKFGHWEVTVSNSKLPTNEKVDAKPIKTDLTGQNLIQTLLKFFQKEVQAQGLIQIEDKVSFEPILRYIEGYAYDNGGKIIPFADVSLKMQMSDKTIYITKADTNGFFTIPPQYIPIFSYYLEYSIPNSKIIVKNTTSEFAKKNKDYLENNKINLMTVTKNDQPIVISVTGTPKTSLQPTQPQQVDESKITITTTPVKGSSLLTISTLIILIFLLISAAVIIFVYIKKHRSGLPPTTPTIPQPPQTPQIPQNPQTPQK